MIRTFIDRELQQFWSTGKSRRIPADVKKRTLKRLEQLDLADGLADLAAIPGNELEALRRDREGQYSVRVNDQWRICFRWLDGAHDVEFTDYH